MRAYGLSNPVAIISNGIDLPFEEQLEIPSWRKKLPASAKVLLFLGRIHPKKGLALLLQSWKIAQPDAQKEGWHLVIAGWEQGSHKKELKDITQSLDLEKSVH